MTHGRDTKTLRDRFNDYVHEKDRLKKDLEEYITAPQFSLDLRWQMFLDAPEDLSNEESFIYHGLDFINDGGKWGTNWLSKISDNIPRGSRIYLLDEIENMFSYRDNEYYSYKGWTCLDEPGILVKIKEQLLKDNIKSFVFDW